MDLNFPKIIGSRKRFVSLKWWKLQFFVHEIYSGNICLFGDVALVRLAMIRIEERKWLLTNDAHSDFLGSLFFSCLG